MQEAAVTVQLIPLDDMVPSEFDALGWTRCDAPFEELPGIGLYLQRSGIQSLELPSQAVMVGTSSWCGDEHRGAHHYTGCFFSDGMGQNGVSAFSLFSGNGASAAIAACRDGAMQSMIVAYQRALQRHAPQVEETSRAERISKEVATALELLCDLLENDLTNEPLWFSMDSADYGAGRPPVPAFGPLGLFMATALAEGASGLNHKHCDSFLTAVARDAGRFHASQMSASLLETRLAQCFAIHIQPHLPSELAPKWATTFYLQKFASSMAACSVRRRSASEPRGVFKLPLVP